MDIKKPLIWLLLILVLGYLCLRLLFTPNYAGVVMYAAEKITITRDKFNIPHVKAKTREGAFYGMGYATAEDRLFQMHMKRMVALGRLSQIFGERSLIVDKIFRTIGMGYWATEADARFKKQDPLHYAAYQAFSDGVNDYVRNSTTLPFDFYLTWTSFQQWQPRDCMAVNSLLNWGQSMDFGGQFIRGFLASNYSMDEIDRLLPFKEEFVLDPHATIVNDEELKKAGYFEEYNASRRNKHKVQPEHIDRVLDLGVVDFADTMETTASNSWVISGNLTKSGKPILANDPHLEVTIPSEWYQFEVEYLTAGGKPLVFKGAAISGGLTSIIGRTQYLAWGCTNVYTDTIDLYKEKLDETNTRYLYDGVWRDLRVRKQVIKVKGGSDLQYEVKHTHRGPLVEYAYFWTHSLEVKEPISMAWSAAHSRYQFAAEAIKFVEIDNFAELKESLSTGLNDAPSINMVFITADNHIGLQVIGSYPIAPYQEEMSGYVKDGTTSKYDWVGMLKGKDRLQLIDPEKGYIVTANNRLASKNFKGGRYASNWLITARAIRISEIIQHKIDHGHKFTVEDNKQIQLDTVDVFCRRLIPQLNTLEPEFKQLFGEWNCNMEASSPEASVYSMFIHKLQQRLKPANVPVEGHHFFNHYTYRYILDATANDHEKLANIRWALGQAKRELEEFFMSKTVSSWSWGKLHLDFMEHRPFSRTPLARLFEKNAPGRGNENTPNVALMRKLPFGDWRCNHRAGIRMVLTYEEGKSEWVIDSGSSETVFSRKLCCNAAHYDDQYKLFINDKFMPFESLPRSSGQAEL